MNFPLYIASRLSLGSDGRKSAPAIKIGVAAVALSIAVMLAAISIVFGFKHEIREKVLGFNPHISLYVKPMEPNEDNILTLTPTLDDILHSYPFIKDASLQLSMPAVLKTKDDFKGIYLKSANTLQLSDFLSKNIISGSFPDFSKEDSAEKIIISEIAARQLHLKPGDKIDTYFLGNEVKVRRLTVAGIFNSHFDSYDDVFAYGSLSMLQQLNGLQPNQGSSLSISTDSFNDIERNSDIIGKVLYKELAEGRIYKNYQVDNALNQGQGYFVWLDLLDMNVTVILVLMTFVACITLISGMLIIILDKKRFIGLMRALGASNRKVSATFVYLALRICLLGMLIGNAIALAILLAQQKFHFIPLDPDAYYIDFVPVEISWPAVLILNAAVMVVAYFVLILPSWFVARIPPSETMRYE